MRPPEDPLDLRAFGASVTFELQSLFERRLVPGDLAIYHSDKPWTPKMRGLLDKMIIELAQTFGWRIYLSELVQRQIARWHNSKEKLHLIKQLGEAVYLAAQVAHEEAQLPVTDPELRALKPQAVSELRRLLRQSRAVFNQYRNRRPSDQEVREWFRKTIKTSPKSFPFWSRNIPSLLQYAERRARVQQIALGGIPPARLFDEWGADIYHLSPKTFRRSVSGLPKLPA